MGTKDAAIAPLGSQSCPAASALIEELAGIGWHRLWLGGGAMGAGDHGLKDHVAELLDADILPTSPQ